MPSLAMVAACVDIDDLLSRFAAISVPGNRYNQAGARRKHVLKK
jgi:hypothetical protein